MALTVNLPEYNLWRGQVGTVVEILADGAAFEVEFFETVSEEQRRKLEVLLSLKLSEATRQKRTLEEVMSDISHKAQSRGLTPEILDSIVNER